MKPMWLLLIPLLGIWVVLAASIRIPESPHLGGVPHPEYRDMVQGGSGLDQHGSLLWLGWAYGSLQLLMLGILIALGMHRPGQSATQLTLMLAGSLLYLVLFAAIMVSYHFFLTESRLRLLGPFPTPTTLAMFGIWAAPFYHVVLYVVTFARSFWTEEDERRLRLLVEREASAGSEQ